MPSPITTLVASFAPVVATSTKRPAGALLAVVAAAGSLVFLARAPASVQALLPCPVHCYLHLLCPGCGGTRACIALLHGNLGQAWHLNALLLLLAPLFILYLAAAVYRLWRGCSQPFPTIPPAAVYALLSAAAVFTLGRNLPL